MNSHRRIPTGIENFHRPNCFNLPRHRSLLSYGFFQFVQCSQGRTVQVNVLSLVRQPLQRFYRTAVSKLL